MRIAVTYEDGQVFQHFGHTKRFKVYDVVDGEVAQATTINVGESGHGALADILKKCSVDVLICGGIGGGAQRALNEAGIEFFGGVSGNADQAVSDFLTHKLVFDQDVQCSHHGEHHDGCGGHDCSCGSH